MCHSLKTIVSPFGLPYNRSMSKNHSHIHLFGDPEENFYSLGKKDQFSYEEIYQQISMLCARNTFFAQVLKFATEYLARNKTLENQSFMRNLDAYAEGLERKRENVAFAMLLPELVAAFNKWSPQLIQYVPGCSSLIYVDPNNNCTTHARILDYALAGPFEKYERSITYDFKGQKKICSFSSSGMPFPSLTGFNEDGLSMALHYKHGEYFNFEGESIFFITQEVLQKCHDIRSAIKLLKTKKSMSYWGIILSDKNGEVASVDINGSDYYQEKFDLNDHRYLYFNNRPLLYKRPMEHLQPFGNHDQCLHRKEQAQKFFEKEKEIDFLTGLKVLGKTKTSKSISNWKMGPLTPSSVQLVSMQAMNHSACFINGEAPKFFLGNYTQLENVFQDFSSKEIQSRKKPKAIHASYPRWTKFQTYLDLGKISEAYHQIQMAEIEMKGHPEEIISKFYFLVVQYIFESDKRDFSFLLAGFESLEGKLPEYLEDHRQLFILRLTKLLGLNYSILKPKISHPKLDKLYQRERNLNIVALKGFKKLIFPRIDITDIIYAY